VYSYTVCVYQYIYSDVFVCICVGTYIHTHTFHHKHNARYSEVQYLATVIPFYQQAQNSRYQE